MSYNLKNFEEMSRKARATANAEMAAFIKSVAPEFDVLLEVEKKDKDQVVRLDLLVSLGEAHIGVEARDPRAPGEDYMEDRAAINQLAEHLRVIGLKDGVVFYYPGRADDMAVGTLTSSSWPRGLNLREVYSDDPENYPDDDPEEPVDLAE